MKKIRVKTGLVNMLVMVLLFNTNLSRAQVSTVQYDEMSEYLDEGLRRVSLKGKHGFIDYHGDEVIPLKYDDAFNFCNGLAPVMLNGKWGYIDVTGKEVIPPKYTYAFNFPENINITAVVINSKCAFIDKTGKELTPFKYTEPSRYYYSEFGGLSILTGGANLGPGSRYSIKYINDIYPALFKNPKTGKGSHPRYLRIGYTEKRVGESRIHRAFREGLAAVEVCPRDSILPQNLEAMLKIDEWRTKIEQVIAQYKDTYEPADSVVFLGTMRDQFWQLYSFWGFIDTTGKEVIPVKYLSVSNFGECSEYQHCWVTEAREGKGEVHRYFGGRDHRDWDRYLYIDILGNEYYDSERRKALNSANKAMRELEKRSDYKPSQANTGKKKN
jgi:hypothetical protein